MVVETYLYELLSVRPDATVDEISRSYKKLALRCHPDKTNHDPELTEKFKEVTRAYEILKDTRMRDIYDKYGEAGFNGSLQDQQTSHAKYDQDIRSATGIFSQMFTNINSMFENCTFQSGFSQFHQFPFGMPFEDAASQNMKKNISPAPADPRDRGLKRGNDIHHACKVTLDSLYTGKMVKFSLPRRTKCIHCNGLGGQNPTSCRVCRGSGRVFVTLYNQFSQFQEMSSCRSCCGTGTYFSPRDKCSYCNEGFLRENKIIKVKILPGFKDGYKIVIKGKADEGPNIIPGDLIIHLEEIKHPFLIRRNNDLYMEYKIDLKTALLGGSIIIDNYLNNENLKVNINVHGVKELNDKIDSHINKGEIMGVVEPNVPKLVKGYGMPINEVANGVVIQGGDTSQDEIDDIHLDNFERGNLFIKFDVKFPLSSDFKSKNDLMTLYNIFPSSEAPVEQYDTEAYVSNIPSIPSRPPNVSINSKNARLPSETDLMVDSKMSHKRAKKQTLSSDIDDANFAEMDYSLNDSPLLEP